MDTAARYLETFEALRRARRWTTDTTVLRFAALTLASTRLDDPARRLEETADVLREHAGWFDPLRSAIRYVVAAMVLRRGRDPRRVAADVAAMRAAFREQRVPRGGVHETVAALLLVLHDAGPSSAARLVAILDRWRVDHPWLTGVDDLPLAALHATRDVPVETVGSIVESVYERLHAAGFSRGNSLQLVSHLLAIDPRGTDEAVKRYVAVTETFAERKESRSSSRYAEFALLALTSPAPFEVVDRVLALRDELRAARPRPAGNVAFSLASGLVLGEEAQRAASLDGARDAATLAALQAVLDAQQAAAIAACTAAIAASSAASSS